MSPFGPMKYPPRKLKAKVCYCITAAITTRHGEEEEKKSRRSGG